MFAAAMRAFPPVTDRLVFLPAIIAERDGRDGVDLEFAPLQELFLVGGPAPAVRQVLRDHRGHFPDVHDDSGDVSDVVLLGDLLDILDDVEYDTQFVHGEAISSC